MQRGCRSHAVVLGALLLATACVNNYVLVETDEGDGGGSGTAQTMPDPTCTNDPCTPTGGDHGSSSSESSSSGSSSGSTDDAASSTTSITGLGRCEECAADSQCAADFDYCVPVVAGPRCLQPCTEMEPVCPEGFSCQSVVSVDGMAAQLCAPVAADCPKEGPGM